MRSGARITGAALLAVLAASGFGCGGGDGDATALSRSDFTARANEICRQAQREFDQIQRAPASTPEGAERQVEALIEVSRQALSELREISPPADLQARYERYLSERERAVGFLEDGREAAADRDVEAYVRAKRRVSSELGTRLQLAREVGLRDCSRPSLTLGGR